MEWKELDENKFTAIVLDELEKEAKNFIEKVKTAKLSLKEKILYGVGQKAIKKAINVLGEEYFISKIIAEGFKKIQNTLDKGETIDFKNFEIKKENGKLYIREKKK